MIDFSKHHPLQNVSVDDMIEWIRAHEADGNIKRMSVVIEAEDGDVYSKALNLQHKDYVYFLLRELVDIFVPEETDDER